MHGIEVEPLTLGSCARASYGKCHLVRVGVGALGIRKPTVDGVLVHLTLRAGVPKEPPLAEEPA